MCHTNCVLANGGSVKDYFTTIKTFLDSNPNEVVTLLITNPESQPITRFQAAMVESGLDTYTFSAPNTIAISAWPTLQTMIDNGKRVVVFLGEYKCSLELGHVISQIPC
jgi:hypothetical protein